MGADGGGQGVQAPQRREPLELAGWQMGIVALGQGKEEQGQRGVFSIGGRDSTAYKLPDLGVFDLLAEFGRQLGIARIVRMGKLT